ncbi:MAG: hypothetical protein ACTHMX_13030 [Thermomicrobiales bacterium]
MVTDGTAPREGSLRPLNLPRPIAVEAAHGHPVALLRGEGDRRSVEILDRWIIEDEWWRTPIVRHYFAVLTEDGVRHTIFRDAVTDRWYAQEY